jgi:hypothetical protein
LSKLQNIAKTEFWFKGEDQDIRFDVKQSDGTTAQTMTGWTLVWELKDSPEGTVRITKTPSIGNGVGTDDRATVSVVDTDTESLGAGTYYHHLRRSDAGSEQILSHGDAVLLESGL